MKTIKIILLVQIILLLASCSTNNFYKRKYTKGRYHDRSANYSPKSSKKRSVQYAQSSTNGKIKEEVVKNKKVEKTQEKIVVEKVKATKIENKNSTLALKEKTKVARKLLKETSSIPATFLKEKINQFKDTKKIDKPKNKTNVFENLSLFFFILTLLTLGLIAFNIGAEIMILIFILSIVGLLVSLVLWAANPKKNRSEKIDKKDNSTTKAKPFKKLFIIYLLGFAVFF